MCVLLVPALGATFRCMLAAVTVACAVFFFALLQVIVAFAPAKPAFTGVQTTKGGKCTDNDAQRSGQSFKGVYLLRGEWRAQLKSRGRTSYLRGSFNTAEEAARAWCVPLIP